MAVLPEARRHGFARHHRPADAGLRAGGAIPRSALGAGRRSASRWRRWRSRRGVRSRARLHGFLAGLVLVLAAVHMINALAPAAGSTVVPERAIRRARSSAPACCSIAALTLRRLRHTLDSLMLTVAIGWAAFARRRGNRAARSRLRVADRALAAGARRGSPCTSSARAYPGVRAIDRAAGAAHRPRARCSRKCERRRSCRG